MTEIVINAPKMNDGIHFVGRDRKKASSAMPAEVRVMAQQMGILPEDMDMAGGMWAKLNELESSDPDAYRELVSESARRVTSGDVDDKMGEAASAAMNKVLPRQTLTPNRGFVLKCRKKIGDEKVMINCCSHKAVQPPVDSSGREFVADMPTDGLQVPMFIGDARSCQVAGGARGTAIDVVFNPTVVECAAIDQDFKKNVSELALRWIAEEKKIEIDPSSWKYIRSEYKGGTGADENEPVPFSVSQSNVKTKQSSASVPKRSGGPTGVIATPESLLQRLRDDTEKINDEEKKVDIKIPSLAAPKATKKKPLIQEIKDDKVIELEPDGFDISSSSVEEEKMVTKKHVLKKGFMKESKKSLYPPEGSDQGQKEGVFSRFLGKCNVVDASTLNNKSAEASANTDSPSANVFSESPESGGLKKGFLQRDPEFDALAAEADPELGAVMGEQRKCENAEVEETLEQLRELTNKMNMERGEGEFASRRTEKESPIYETEPDDAPPPSHKSVEKPDNGDDDNSFKFKSGFLKKDKEAQRQKYELVELSHTKDGRRRVKMIIRLEDKSIESMDEIELVVAHRLVELRHSKRRMKLPLPTDFVADSEKTKARFSKHKGQLSITLTACSSME